jgi:hypothetical protein
VRAEFDPDERETLIMLLRSLAAILEQVVA